VVRGYTNSGFIASYANSADPQGPPCRSDCPEASVAPLQTQDTAPRLAQEAASVQNVP